jgi:hypothetical protein
MGVVGTDSCWPATARGRHSVAWLRVVDGSLEHMVAILLAQRCTLDGSIAVVDIVVVDVSVVSVAKGVVVVRRRGSFGRNDKISGSRDNWDPSSPQSSSRLC